MKKIVLAFFVLAIVLVSCDGRQSSKEAFEKSITEFNSTHSKIQKEKYYPEHYTEVVTDTIIESQLQVHVKNYSLMHKNVMFAGSQDLDTKLRSYHRVFESKISIKTTHKVVFNTIINAKEFSTKFKDQFWDNATLQQVWVNEESSSLDAVNFNLSFINPQTNTYKLYEMIVDLKGNQSINLIEES